MGNNLYLEELMYNMKIKCLWRISNTPKPWKGERGSEISLKKFKC